MESAAPFDLNDAIRQWRTNWAEVSSLRREDLDELESHLRDSALNLQAAGLSPEKAFVVASQRLGRRPELEREFGKMNPQRVWLGRAVWMLAGFLFFSLISRYALMIRPWMEVPISYLPLSAHWIGFLYVCSRWVSFVLLIALSAWCFDRHQERVNQLVRWCLNHPLLPLLGIVFLNYGWHPLRNWTLNWLIQVIPQVIPTEWHSYGELHRTLEAPTISAWWIWGLRVEMVFWAVALAYLAWRHWRKAQDFLRLERVNSNAWTIWRERCLWIVTGSLLGTNFVYYLVLVVGIALVNCLPSYIQYVPAGGQILGLLSVALHWAALAGLVASLWWLVTRCHRLSTRITHFCHRRPAWGVVGLLVLYVGFWSLRFFSAPLLSRLTTPEFQSDFYFQAMRWNAGGSNFLNYVVLVVVFFWLARRRMRWSLSNRSSDRFRPAF